MELDQGVIWLTALAIAAAFALAIARRSKQEPAQITLYRRQGNLFTAAERSFLGVLDQATARRYRVFGKVRIADILTPVKGLDRSTWQTAFNRINAKHFDFVLCDPETLEVKAVIELNDKSHKGRRRVDRDELVGRACADAGLPLRVVPAQRSYRLEEIRQIVEEVNREVQADPASTAVPTTQANQKR